MLYGADTQDELRKEFDQLYIDMNIFKMELPDGERVNVRASGGVAWYPIDSTEYSTLMRYADLPLYQVKIPRKENTWNLTGSSMRGIPICWKAEKN